MWEVLGEPIAPERFDPFQPSEVLDQYDGPRVFTFTSRHEEFYLAFWCDSDHECERYLVVPFNASMRDKLTGGQISVVDALDQPWLWVVDTDRTGRPSRSWRSALQQLPREILPEPGTMLFASLDPLLSVRALGVQIDQGITPASVIRDTIDAAEKALKILIEYVLEQVQALGRPVRAVRELYDLPAIGFRFLSFEISFGPPSRKDQPTLEEAASAASDENDRIYSRVKGLLAKGLKSPLQGLLSPEHIGDNPEESRVILRAIEKLAPPSSGYVESIELRGQLVGDLVRGQQAVRLERGLRPAIRRAIRVLSGESTEDRVLTGLIRELDKDRSTFELREIEDPGFTTQKYSYEPALEEEIFDACQGDKRVRVIGVKEPSEKQFSVIAIRQLESQG
jgi:hypothetical protein